MAKANRIQGMLDNRELQVTAAEPAGKREKKTKDVHGRGLKSHR